MDLGERGGGLWGRSGVEGNCSWNILHERRINFKKNYYASSHCAQCSHLIIKKGKRQQKSHSLAVEVSSIMQECLDSLSIADFEGRPKDLQPESTMTSRNCVEEKLILP